jgi:hypothetical protein
MEQETALALDCQDEYTLNHELRGINNARRKQMKGV